MKKNPADQSAIIIPPTHEDIQQRAIRLWESYGQPSGRDTEIWLEAERQLLGVDPKIEARVKASPASISFDEPISTGKAKIVAPTQKSSAATARSKR